MNIINKSLLAPILLLASLACSHASADDAQATPVPLKIEVSHAGVTSLAVDGVIQGGLTLNLSQPGRTTSKRDGQAEYTNGLSDIHLKLQILAVTRKTVSVAIDFSDETDTSISRDDSFYRDSVKGSYAAAGGYVLEKGKAFNLPYKLCENAKYAWCEGSLSLTANWAQGISE